MNRRGAIGLFLRSAILLILALVLAVSLAGWAVFIATSAASATLSVAIYLLVSTVVMTDFVDLLARLYLRKLQSGSAAFGEVPETSMALPVSRLTPHQKRLRLRPYALAVSVYNMADELDEFLVAMAPYKDRLWVVDDASTDDTVQRLRQAGVRCLAAARNQKKPGAIKALLAEIPAEIQTVLVLDPDIIIGTAKANAVETLETIIFDFQGTGAAAATPRVSIRATGLLTSLQAFEYHMACRIGRSSLGDYCVNSGIAVYRRDALEAALREHSQSVYAEDFENSTILLAKREQIYYDDRLIIQTEGKESWRGWFSQRVGWHYGLIKVYLGRFDSIRRIAKRSRGAGYEYLVYLGCFSLLFQPIKLMACVVLAVTFFSAVDDFLYLNWIPDHELTNPIYFLATYANYLILTTLVLLIGIPREERWSLLPVAPLYLFYVLAHIIAATVGYLNWFTLRLWGRRVYRDHFQDEESLRAATN